jgi:hypothetical protein
MAKKKTKRKKPSARKSRPVKKVRAGAKVKGKVKVRVKVKAALRGKAPQGQKVAAKRKPKPARRAPRGQPLESEIAPYERRGLGARTGGQSGDTQGIDARPGGDSESVKELLEEGQSYEAEVVDGVENAPDPDQGEVRTHEVKEDDVPEEYLDKD